jgi:hypothetical protein
MSETAVISLALPTGQAAVGESLSVRYRVPHESIPSIKEFAIRWLRRRIRYADFWALKNISLEVRRDEIVGIVGANGAGKSTLLKVIARVLHPTEGRVVAAASTASRARGRSPPELTAGNVYLYGALLGNAHRDWMPAFAASSTSPSCGSSSTRRCARIPPVWSPVWLSLWRPRAWRRSC